MQNLTPEGLALVADIANRHGVSVEAAQTLLGALAEGGGRQAQFNHPDLGGMGQWSQGGMIMVGDMFNHGLKARVDGLCNQLAGLLQSQPSPGADLWASQTQSQGGDDAVSLFAEGSRASSQWWPAALGAPASAGAQNDMRYAFFPRQRRLAIQQGGHINVYDTGEHQLSGFSQRQGSDQSLTFTSQFGLVRVADLPLVAAAGEPAHKPATPAPPPQAPHAPGAPTAPHGADDVLKTIERLAELRRKDILTQEEFAAKKAELLARL